MKKHLRAGVAAIALAFISITSFAQKETSTFIPRYISAKGYWVTESNKNSPLTHIIRFYTNDDVQVYKETLTGVKLNINKRKTKMKLKRVLESAVLAWEKRRIPEENKDYVAAVLK